MGWAGVVRETILGHDTSGVSASTVTLGIAQLDSFSAASRQRCYLLRVRPHLSGWMAVHWLPTGPRWSRLLTVEEAAGQLQAMPEP